MKDTNAMSELTFQGYLSPSKETLPETEMLCDSRQDLSNALLRLEDTVIPEDVPQITELNDKVADLAVKVSLIGQVKAGKTALANALLGVSELLPSDVNPWTSVVTSVHINRIAPKGKKAIFRFFDTQDWEDLISNSGQIVKMAKAAKLDSRVDELTTQIEELKTRTESRLGRNFKMLLGNQHSFSAFNSDLIKRYVCLGEDDLLEEREGRFADLTKSADLFMENENFNYPITIADTPGVNDPFLVREAATLENLRTSDIYVVVLSAHQALSSVDLGLLRLLKSLHSKRLIVFINRIDELPDPQSQIEEIRTYVTGILDKQNNLADVPIIFGSAAWADAGIRGDYDNLPDDSIESLGALVERRMADLKPGVRDRDNINNLVDVSGVSALRDAINCKAWDEVYNTKISKYANEARLLTERSLLSLSKFNDGPNYVPDPNGIRQATEDLSTAKVSMAKTFDKFSDSATNKLKMSMVEIYRSFHLTEKRALIASLSQKRNAAAWAPDTETLRGDLNASYRTYVDEAEAFLRTINMKVMQSVAAAYEAALGSSEGVRITPLQFQQVPVPVSLMRTMSIDMRASGSLDWLRRKLDKSVYLDQFEATLNADTRAVVTEACDEGISQYLALVQTELQKHIDQHRATIEAFGQTGNDAFQAWLKEVIEGGSDMALRCAALRETGDILYALDNALLGDGAKDTDAAQVLELAE